MVLYKRLRNNYFWMRDASSGVVSCNKQLTYSLAAVTTLFTDLEDVAACTARGEM